MTTKEWEGDFDPMADPDEQKHLLSVLDSFRSYRRLAHLNGTHVRRQAFYSLPSSHWTLLSQPPFSILSSLSRLDDLIDSNARLAEAIFVAGFEALLAPTLSPQQQQDVQTSLLSDPTPSPSSVFEKYSAVMDTLPVEPSHSNMEKARSCINQFYREWSAAGAVERNACFAPVLSALTSEFEARKHHPRDQGQSNPLQKSDLHVLVPGAGLGRLVFDIALAGFTVEGNEISYHELMASSLVLNHTSRVDEYSIAPFALNGSNQHSREDQFRTYGVPDVHPGDALTAAAAAAAAASSSSSQHENQDENKPKNSEHTFIPPHERMSMSTGDFCILYSAVPSADTFDAVATVFFIDTAPNLIRYIETIRHCLRPGGLWINLGPLLWHHANRAQSQLEEKRKLEKEGNKKKTHDNDDDDDDDTRMNAAAATEALSDRGIADPGSVELTHEEVVALVQHLGFAMEKQEVGAIETGYISDDRSMLRNTYRPVFWVARKM